MSTTSSACKSTWRRSGSRDPLRDDAADEHTPEYAAILRGLLQSANVLIAVLKADIADDIALHRAVTDYVAQALTAGISRTRIRDALELLVREHGGTRWCAAASAIALLAMRDQRDSTAGAPRSA